MSALQSIYFKKETLKKVYDTLEKKGEKGIEITVSVSDETNQYGQNVAAFVSQSKEEREEKKPRFYVGNGKVFWTDGTIKKAEKQEDNTPVQDAEVVDDVLNGKDDLPF